ncbi:winged helix-turn-helix domain-containing protein [Prosthecobacter dejongeii]|uniref:Winged helix-turn helix domain-containing protein n=1 Tax=Prosthecobacter dejongeii TaxID=48465 RepID=A0A7W7YJV1_9BACT|nr:winged helix-turn-helix domain-containing protein [Prosthecobacter dejongeii]MBB5037570.1 hypothetical protein [Prosthecobacter dejongeii]
MNLVEVRPNGDNASLKDVQVAMEHWTGVKVHGWLIEQLQVELSYNTVIRYLHDLGFNLRVPCKWSLPLLDELAKSVPLKEGVSWVLVLDNASWHKVKSLRWHHFEVLFYRHTARTSIPLSDCG